MTANNHVTLPQAAIDHMSHTAQEHVPTRLLPIQTNFVWDNPLTTGNVDTGIAGEHNVFVFDIAAMVANGTFDPNVGIVDHIQGFQPGLDEIAFINVSPSISGPTGQLADLAAQTFGGGAQVLHLNGGFNVDTVLTDGVTSIPNISVHQDNTVTLLDGTIVTMPQDPWLLA